jgi:DNA-binding transcriptional ArsR family regulator
MIGISFKMGSKGVGNEMGFRGSLRIPNSQFKEVGTMLKELKDESIRQEQTIRNIGAPEVLAFFETVFKNDVRLRIICILSSREGACLREIARNAGISHKNLTKYLDALLQKGVIESYPVGPRNKVYRLSTKYNFLRDFMQTNLRAITMSISSS